MLWSVEGYGFTVDRKRETAKGMTTYWKCASRLTSCKARVVDTEGVYSSRGVHNHEPTDGMHRKREMLSKVSVQVYTDYFVLHNTICLLTAI